MPPNAPQSSPLNPKSVLLTNPYCGPLRTMYEHIVSMGAGSWNQIEDRFLGAMSEFDTGLPTAPGTDKQSKELSAAIQNGKGDWFNNLLAVLLQRCAGIDALYVRRKVPGLIIPEHNLDGVYPGEPDREIEFLFEAKMMGTPKHANSPGEKPSGRSGSADTNKRVKELAFKSIDLKGEAARRQTILGGLPSGGGAGGGDLSTWLHASRPRIYFFMAVRVLSDSDFTAVLRWAATAAQVVDAVGLYTYEPEDDSFTRYRRRGGVPTEYELERVPYRACVEIQGLQGAPPRPLDAVPPSPAVAAVDSERAQRD